MHNIVKEVFMLIMAVTIAALLFFVLFGSWNDEGVLDSTKDFNYEEGTAKVQTQGGASWQGVLWYSARVMENPIAYYYYNYCLTPNVHKNDYLDIELGSKIYGQTDMANVTVQQMRNQATSVVSPDAYTTFPGEFNGPTESIVSFGSHHYHYTARESDF